MPLRPVAHFSRNGDFHQSNDHLPDAFEVHGPDLDHMPHLLALQDAVATTSGHSRDIQQLGAVDHVIIYG